MNNFYRLLACIPCIIILASCHQHSHEDDHHHVFDEAKGSEKHDNGIVHLTREQMQSIGLTLGTLEQRSLTGGFKANGFLKVPNQNKATVTSLYSGTINKLLIMPGSHVEKGMTIATIVNPEFISMQEEYLGLEPELHEAEATYRRQQELVNGNAGALKHLQSAEAALGALRVRRAALQQQLEMAHIPVSRISPDHLVTEIPVITPIAGSVGTVGVNLGAHVDSGIPVAEVVDNSQLHLDLFVYEKDLPLVKKGQSIDFILTNRPGRTYTAEVFSIGTTFEQETRAIAVHCIVKGDKQGLIEGMSVTAQLNTMTESTPALPSDAIVNHDGVDFVFVKLHEDDHDVNTQELRHADSQHITCKQIY